MVTWILSAIVVVLVTALATLALWGTRVVLRTIVDVKTPDTTPAPPYDDRWIHEALDRLTVAVSDGIRNTKRAENRVRGIVRNAEKRAEEAGYYDAGIAAEAAALRDDDESGGHDEQLQIMPEGVEPNRQPFLRPPSPIPGEVTRRSDAS